MAEAKPTAAPVEVGEGLDAVLLFIAQIEGNHRPL